MTSTACASGPSPNNGMEVPEFSYPQYKGITFAYSQDLKPLVKESTSSTSCVLLDCRQIPHQPEYACTRAWKAGSKEQVDLFYQVYKTSSPVPERVVLFGDYAVDESLKMAIALRDFDLADHNGDANELLFKKIFVLWESFGAFQRKYPDLVQAGQRQQRRPASRHAGTLSKLYYLFSAPV